MRPLIELMAVQTGRRGNQGAVAMEHRLSEFQHAQVGPGFCPDAQKLGCEVDRRSAGLRLGEYQQHGCGGSRDSGMAVHQQMRAGRRFAGKIAAEGEKLFDVHALGRGAGQGFLDHIIKAKFEPAVLIESVEGRRDGNVRVEDRQDMGDAGLAVTIQLFDAADGELERRGQRHGVLSGGTAALSSVRIPQVALTTPPRRRFDAGPRPPT